MTIRNEMIAIADLTIQTIAQHHGYAPGEYDTETDPDDFCAAVLTGLHHWCDATAGSWDETLRRADWSYQHDCNVDE